MTTTITMTKRLEIDAGHRLVGHEGKCAHLHGHRYAFEITCSADALDNVGRVIDFSVIKQHVGGWLDKHLDHGFIVNVQDHALGAFLLETGSKCYVMDGNPTAENLAALVLWEARVLLGPFGVHVVSVRCYETPTSSAEAR